MRYTPTPRDLFNPPPQAHVFNNQNEIEELAVMIQAIYPSYYDDRQAVLLRILNILKEHDEHVFRGI
jgi:hypothetical protein